eukprot:953605-Pyramimonas_sp.AAC.1
MAPLLELRSFGHETKHGEASICLLHRHFPSNQREKNDAHLYKKNLCHHAEISNYQLINSHRKAVDREQWRQPIYSFNV